MVARKSPLGPRLDTAHRGYGSRMFRKDGARIRGKRRAPSVNVSASRDWLGWNFVHTQGVSDFDYGLVMSLNRDVVSYVTASFEEKDMFVNRCPMVWDGCEVSIRVEYVHPYGRPVRRDERFELKSELSRIGAELESLYRGKGLAGLTIVFVDVPLLNVFMKDADWRREFSDLVSAQAGSPGSRLYEMKDYRRRVSQKGMRSVLMLASFWPVAPLVCQMIAHMLERTMKHGEVVSDIRAKLSEVSKQKEFGLLNHVSVAEDKRREAVEQGELGAAYGLRIRGGYRGYVITVSGTLDGSRRTYKEEIKDGVIPLSSVALPVSHSSGVAKTKIGTRGVHVTYSY